MNNLLTAKEAAEFLRLSVCTVYRYSQLGMLPQIRKSFGLRFQKDDLLEWIKKDLKRPICLVSSVSVPRGTARIYRGEETGKMPHPRSRSRHNFNFGAVYTRTSKDGIPRWYYDFRNSAGKRIQRVIPLATSEEEALLALQEEVRREFDSEYRAQKERKKILFGSLADTYLEDYAKNNKKSWRDDQYRITAK